MILLCVPFPFTQKAPLLKIPSFQPFYQQLQVLSSLCTAFSDSSACQALSAASAFWLACTLVDSMDPGVAHPHSWHVGPLRLFSAHALGSSGIWRRGLLGKPPLSRGPSISLKYLWHHFHKSCEKEVLRGKGETKGTPRPSSPCSSPASSRNLIAGLEVCRKQRRKSSGVYNNDLKPNLNQLILPS